MKTVNQNIKPLTAKRNSAGNLEIGGCDTVELVQKYGTPLYVMDEITLRTMAREYKDAFKSYPNTNILYASKALMTSAVAKIADSEGLGFDAVSGGEIHTIKNANVDMAKVVFNGNNKSVEELSMALEVGVGRISADNFLELDLLNEIAKSHNKVQKIFLRVTPGIECHTHEYIQTGHLDSKFGFDLTQTDEALELLRDEYSNLELVGLHAHIGSQIFETRVYNDEAEVLIKEIVRINTKYGLNLDELNLGGGLGITYTQSDNPPSTYAIAEAITESLKKNAQKYNIALPKIYIEPGRSMVGTAGVTLYTIGSSKQVPNGKKYIAVDGGMSDNARVITYGAVYSAEIANAKEDTELEKVTVAGRFCESGDILIKEINLPNPESGDILCVYNTGAYNYSMSSNYNCVPKPAMVLVNSAQSDMIVARETFAQLTQNDIIPDRL